MNQYKIGDRIVCNNPNLGADYGKSGTIVGILDVSVNFNYLKSEYPKGVWYDVSVTDESDITAYHESELLPEDSLIKDH